MENRRAGLASAAVRTCLILVIFVCIVLRRCGGRITISRKLDRGIHIRIQGNGWQSGALYHSKGRGYRSTAKTRSMRKAGNIVHPRDKLSACQPSILFDVFKFSISGLFLTLARLFTQNFINSLVNLVAAIFLK